MNAPLPRLVRGYDLNELLPATAMELSAIWGCTLKQAHGRLASYCQRGLAVKTTKRVHNGTTGRGTKFSCLFYPPDVDDPKNNIRLGRPKKKGDQTGVLLRTVDRRFMLPHKFKRYVFSFLRTREMMRLRYCISKYHVLKRADFARRNPYTVLE